MLIKTLAGVGLFALLGGAVGYSQVLCPDGGCAITGTPYGGALFGGMLGLAVMGGISNPKPAAGAAPETQPDGAKEDGVK